MSLSNKMLYFLKAAVVLNVVIPFLFVTVPWGLGPEGDAMDYRMSLVRWIFAHKDLPSFPWTYNDDYPPLGEILMALSLYLGAWGPRLISALAYGSFVAATLRLSQLFLPQVWIWIAVLLVASMNLITTQDNLLMVDLLASSFTVWGMVFLFQYWWPHQKQLRAPTLWLLMAAGFTWGLALLTRYTQLVPVAILSGVHGIFAINEALQKPKLAPSQKDAAASAVSGVTLTLKQIFAVAAPAAMVFGPWLIRNQIENQNPFFPLFTGFLGGKNFDASRAVEMAKAQQNYGVGKSVVDFLLLPLNLIRFKNAYDYSAGPFYLLFLPWWGLLLFEKHKKWFLPLSVLLLLTLGWYLSSQQTRFLMYAMPLAVILGLASVWCWSEKISNKALKAGFVGLFIVMGLGGTAKHFMKHKNEALDLIDSVGGKPQWSRSIAIPQLDAITWLNSQHGGRQGSVVLLERTNNVALLDVPYVLIYPHFYSTSVYDYRRYASPEDFYDDLRQNGVQFLYITNDKALGSLPPLSDGQSPWKIVFSSASNGARIYALKSKEVP